MRQTDLLSQDKAVGGGVAEPRVQRVELVGGAGHAGAAAQAVHLDEVSGQRGHLLLPGARARLGRAEVEAPLCGILQLLQAMDRLSGCMLLTVQLLSLAANACSMGGLHGQDAHQAGMGGRPLIELAFCHCRLCSVLGIWRPACQEYVAMPPFLLADS